MTNWVSAKLQLPKDGAIVIGADFDYRNIGPDFGVFLFLEGRFHIYAGGIKAENDHGPAEILQDMDIKLWMPLTEQNK